MFAGKNIHFIGIKGVGMSGLALLLKNEGAIVSGSDFEKEWTTDKILKSGGIKVLEFNATNITKKLDLVIYSSAYFESHPERAAAKLLGIDQKSYSEALGLFAADKKNIVVTGTHGKTTTTALLAGILKSAGTDVTALVGEVVRSWQKNVLFGKSEYFVIEGDEYQEKFRNFKPHLLVITSLDYDHPDYYANKDIYLSAFRKYINENDILPVIASEDAKKLKLRNYFHPDKKEEGLFKKSRFILPGKAYKKDALLASRAAREFGIKDENIIKGLSEFQGVQRRLDLYTPKDSKISVWYDYAHHPVEIESTLEALSEKYPAHRIIAVFQPHTYSRTEKMLKEFSKSFRRAEMVFLDEIYGSAREEKGGVKIEALLSLTKKVNKKSFLLKDFSYRQILKLTADFPKTAILFMGAGDIREKAAEFSRLLGGKN